MDIVIREQLSALFWSLLLGAGLSVLYDLLRALRLHRRKQRALTDLADLVYCAALAVAALAFASRLGGGELRLYMLLAALVGMAVSFRLLSPLLRPLWEFWAECFFALLRLLRLPLRLLKNFAHKARKLVQRLFLFTRKSCIIGAWRRTARTLRRRDTGKEAPR